GAALHPLESAIDDALGNGLLALVHDRIHELRDHLIAVLGISVDLALLGSVAAGHASRSCLRSSRWAAHFHLEHPVWGLMACARRNERIVSVSDHFGRFAPYLERRCLRSATPWVSRTPRMMW